MEIQVSQMKNDMMVIEFKAHKFRDYTIIYHNFPNLFDNCIRSKSYMFASPGSICPVKILTKNWTQYGLSVVLRLKRGY
jgi:hypothetical protein